MYCNKRRGIRWNIAWDQGKSRGRSPRDFPRAQAIFHRIPRLESQYSHSQSPLLANIFSYWGLLTSTSQYFLVLRPPDLRRPQYEKILASRGRSIVTVVFQYSIIWWLRMWFNRGMGPKLKSFILAIFSPVCNAHLGSHSREQAPKNTTK